MRHTMNKLFSKIAIVCAGLAISGAAVAGFWAPREVAPVQATISTSYGVTTVEDEVYDFDSVAAISKYGCSTNIEVGEEEKGCIHFSCNGYRRYLQFDHLIPDGCRLVSNSVVVSISGACREDESYSFHINLILYTADDEQVAQTTGIVGPGYNNPLTEYILHDATLTPNESKRDAVKKLYIYVTDLIPNANPEQICRLKYVKLSYAYEEIYTQTEGLGEGGRFYVVNYDSSYGMSNAAVSDASPAGIDLSTANNALLPFDLTLVGHNTYEISTTINVEDVPTKHILINDNADTSGSDNSIRIMTAPSPSVTLTSTNWKITKVADGYTIAQNTTGDTWRYLSFNTDGAYDFRGYTSVKTMGEDASEQDSHIQLVPEGDYVDQIVDAINSEEEGKTLCDGGSTAPSTALWNSIAGITKIENELAVLRETTAAERDVDGLTPSGSKKEKAMARYDYIVGKYGKSTYSDFLGRDPSVPSFAYSVFENVQQSSSDALIIAMVLLAGLVFAGGLVLILRKRPQADK